MYDGLQEKYGFIPMNHEAPVFFPIGENGVYDDKGRLVPGYKRIERGDTGDTLAIHTDSYKLVPYERHFELFENAIRAAKLPTPVVGTDMEKNGAQIFRQYLFPDFTHEIEGRAGKHDVALRIVMFDSYDGSSAFIGKCGYFDFACANKAFIGMALGDVKFRHVGDMDAKVRVAAEQLAEAASEFPRTVSRMKAWSGVRLVAQQVEAIAKALPQANRGLVDHLVSRWAKQDEDSLWGVHQVLTSWASHGDGDRVVPARTQADRGKRIQTLIEGRDWKMLEPA
jgi:hypothetical protein